MRRVYAFAASRLASGVGRLLRSLRSLKMPTSCRRLGFSSSSIRGAANPASRTTSPVMTDCRVLAAELHNPRKPVTSAEPKPPRCQPTPTESAEKRPRPELACGCRVCAIRSRQTLANSVRVHFSANSLTLAGQGGGLGSADMNGNPLRQISGQDSAVSHFWRAVWRPRWVKITRLAAL